MRFASASASASDSHAPRDQAQGLRRLFAGSAQQVIALVSNPHVAFGSVLLERLSTALTQLNLNTLLIDAADTSPPPAEWAALNLAAAIEPLSAQLSYLAARGLPLRHVDTRGSSAHWLQQVAQAAPHAQVLVVHATATDLGRLLGTQAVRPLLLADETPDSMTHAYAAMKLLAQRCALLSYDLLIAAPPHSRMAQRIAERLASCADRFLGAALRDWVSADPASDVREPPCSALLRLARELCRPEPTPDDAPRPESMAWMRRRAQPLPSLNPT